jgi:hypothetical protein
MKPEVVFQIVNAAAPLGWLLLVIAPRWKGTQTLIVSGLLPGLLAVVYLALIGLFFGSEDGNFSTLQGVMSLFTSPWAVVTGWVHYLAFDLWIGCWELRNSQQHGIRHWLVVPCLLLTFFFGPIGLLLYFIVRGLHTKQWVHANF